MRLGWLHDIGAFWRFLIGVALLQGSTGLLVFFAFAEGGPGWALVLPVCGLVATSTALWFSTASKSDLRDHAARVSAQFAREREELRVQNEQARVRETREAERRVAKAQRTRGLPLKMGLAGGAVAGVGVALMLTQFITLGLAAVALAGGAAVGWRLRAPARQPPILDVTPERAPRRLAAPRGWLQRVRPERG